MKKYQQFSGFLVLRSVFVKYIAEMKRAIFLFDA